MIRCHRISKYPQVNVMWNKLAPLAVAPHPITPRFVKYISNLGLFNTHQPSFLKAVQTLQAQQDYLGIVAEIGEPCPYFTDNKDTHPAVPSLHVLLADGLISPAAAAWLAQCIHQDKMVYNMYSEQKNRFSKGQILLVSQIVAQKTKVNPWEFVVTKLDIMFFVVPNIKYLALFVDLILDLEYTHSTNQFFCSH